VRRNGVIEQLSKALTQGQLVQVTRRRGWDVMNGVIVTVGRKWSVLALAYDAAFYGHSIIRTRDIKTVAAQPPSFIRQALETEGHWPMPALEQVDVSGSTKAMIDTLTALDKPLAFHRERLDPDSCLIGLPIERRRREFRIQTIDTLARWDTDPSDINYGDLTRVDVDDPYVTRLSRISRAQPTSQEAR
jgi:hypothetical protein